MTSSPVMRVGDSRDLSSLGLAESSVDCIITSPPYWHLKQYADGDEREIGHQQTKEAYREAVEKVFDQCSLLAKPDGVMWLVIDTLRHPAKHGGSGELIPLPFQLAEEASKSDWRLQEVVIWQKNKTLPYSGTGKLRNLIEYVLFFTKGSEFKHRPYRCATRHRPDAEWLAGWPERYHPLGKRPSNTWFYDIDTQGMWDHAPGMHACPFPQDLVARMLALTTDPGDVVLDPFAGIGTVPAQAAAMGRVGYGMELNPDNVETFEQHILPQFQADWEAGTERRRLELEDQLGEAELILKLRLLKAGKELLRLTERLATSNTSSHPASAVEGVLVLQPKGLRGCIDVDGGHVDRPEARLLVIADLADAERERLQGELQPPMTSPPFSTFGLHVSVEVVPWAALEVRGIPDNAVLEFGQSRQGAFTAPMKGRLFDAKPRLMTTVELASPVRGTKRTVLSEARDNAERRLLAREVATGDGIDVLAARLGIPQAELYDLLMKHELTQRPASFAISLPTDQLSLIGD